MIQEENNKSQNILLVLPYGMCLRQMLTNKILWEGLSEKYNIDVMTPLRIENSDKLGIRNVIQFYSKYRVINFFEKLNNKYISFWRLTELAKFLLDNDLGENLSLRWKWFPEKRKSILFLGALRYSVFYKYFNKLFRLGPYFHPVKRKIKKGDYKFIVIGHVSDIYCTLVSLYANKLDIPLFTITLGLDNYIHGALLYTPDLMLLWGGEHSYEFKSYHLSLYGDLKSSKSYISGNLMHDTYIDRAKNISRNELNILYDLDVDEEIILIPTMDEKFLSNQVGLCKSVVDFIKKFKLKIRVIVRILPGCDVKMWNQYYNDNREYIIIQEPKSSSYDKRNKLTIFDMEKEYHEIDVFLATIKYSSLIVNLYPTTLLLDAMLFNTPSVFAMFDWTDSSDIGTHPQQKFYLAKSITHPYRKGFNILQSQKELNNLLADFFVDNNRDNLVMKELYNEVCGPSCDGKSGERALDSIEKYLLEHNI